MCKSELLQSYEAQRGGRFLNLIANILKQKKNVKNWLKKRKTYKIQSAMQLTCLVQIDIYIITVT